MQKKYTQENTEEVPELYDEEEMNRLEAFIEEHFGDYKQVFHEIVSPDIHVDIAIIEPNEKRNYYTLVTMGMGAHRMNVPKELADKKLERAELVVCLPPDWKLPTAENPCDAEEWYWPLRWLKILARLPGEENTWLGWGHTVPNGGPFAENTALCGVLLASPTLFSAANEIPVCVLPGEDEVNFYQMIPLYEEELAYKRANRGATALLERLGDMAMIVDICRPNVCAEEKL